MTNLTTQAVRSMTGQGHATAQGKPGTLAVELRTINSRGFKCVARICDSLSSMESKIDALVRSRIHRGTVHLAITLRNHKGEDFPKINRPALKTYLRELRDVRDSEGLRETIDLSQLLFLPGVLNSEKEDHADEAAVWVFVETAIINAVDNLNQMRDAEGQRMAEILLQECRQLEARLGQIESLAPRVVDGYRNRLQAKIERILEENNLPAQSTDLLREVQLYADRVDISEEVVRLGSHVAMFSGILEGGDQPEPTGRKLDFVLQEMFREANTIGSKASHAEISASVVEVKCAIERMRELVQNLE